MNVGRVFVVNENDNVSLSSTDALQAACEPAVNLSSPLGVNVSAAFVGSVPTEVTFLMESVAGVTVTVGAETLPEICTPFSASLAMLTEPAAVTVPVTSPAGV